MPAMKTIWKDFTSMFFPDTCTGCNEALLGTEEILCTNCLASLPTTDHVLFPENNPVYERLLGRIKVKQAMAYLYFSKEGMVQNMLHKLKYHNRKDVGFRIGAVLAEAMKKSNQLYEYDLIIPVPLHETRLRRRGYNQSTCFAEGIAEGLGIPINEHVIERLTATNTQTHKSRIKRWENVNTVFSLKDTEAIQGKHILIVDDVMTTGATIEACAQVAVDAAESISVAFIATAR
jgi:ComF family protein